MKCTLLADNDAKTHVRVSRAHINKYIYICNTRHRLQGNGKSCSTHSLFWQNTCYHVWFVLGWGLSLKVLTTVLNAATRLGPGEARSGRAKPGPSVRRGVAPSVEYVYIQPGTVRKEPKTSAAFSHCFAREHCYRHYNANNHHLGTEHTRKWIWDTKWHCTNI